MSDTISSGQLPTITESSRRAQGRDAQSTNIAAARALGEVVRTTLGPDGLDKMLVGSDGKVIVTNDGASIIERMDIEHPAAQVVVDVAATQREAAGDGTTTAVVLAGTLLENAEDLLEQGFHPTTVTDGYHRAAGDALELLRREAVEVDAGATERLLEVASTAITGKWGPEATAFFAQRAVEAVQAITRDGTVDFDRISRKTVSGGSVFDTELVDGLIIDMEQSSTDVVSPDPGAPRRIEDATVALVDGELTVETVTDQGRVSVDSPADLDRFRQYEEEVYDAHVQRIVDAGADVVFCQKSVDDAVRYLLAKAGVLAVERTRQDELHKLARATGATPVAKTDELTTAETGTAGLIARRAVGPTQLTVVSDCAGFEQVSLLLRGETEQIVAETKRVIDGCLYALKHAVEGGRVVPGGGAVETRLARELESYADGISGREQFAVRAFAESLTTIPKTLATSAGLNPIDSLVELRSRQHDGATRAGLASGVGVVDDTLAHGVVDPLEVKQRAISGAVEAANVLLRVDDIITASAESGHGSGDEHDHDHGPGDVVEASGGYPWTLGH